MKATLKPIFFVGALLLLTACATQQFPQTGTATPYDGMWFAKLPSTDPACAKATSKFEVRYGMVIGTVSEKGRRIADIWGNLDGNGHLEGMIGQLGISGASVNINFTENKATGTWYNKTCKGTVEASRTR